MKKQRRFILLLFLGLMGLVFSSCATIRYGGKSEILIISDPTIVNLRIKNARNLEVVYEGQTPTYVTLRKNQSGFLPARYNIEVFVEGAPPVVVELTANKFRTGWYLVGNLANLGVGWIVDLFSGGAYAWNMWEVVEGKGAVSGNVSVREGNTLQILYKEVDGQEFNEEHGGSYFE